MLKKIIQQDKENIKPENIRSAKLKLIPMRDSYDIAKVKIKFKILIIYF